jgi:hypothetical protein
MNIRWGRLGGQLGILYCVVGLFLVFLGWNGAATYNSVPAQFPYLISGGLAGLCLVVVGAALIVAQSHRADRAALQGTLDELRAAVERAAAAAGTGAAAGAQPALGDDAILAGPSAYHRVTCRVIEGQGDLTPMTAAAAVASGRSPCRVCAPDAAVA